MSPTRAAPRGNRSHRYPRTARLNESLREVIAEELTRIDDERLELVTITAIDVDPEMNRAIVFFDSLVGEDGDEEILEALRRAPGPAAELDRPPDPGQEDADPVVPARRGDPLGRADRADPARRDDDARAARADAGRRRRRSTRRDAAGD